MNNLALGIAIGQLNQPVASPPSGVVMSLGAFLLGIYLFITAMMLVVQMVWCVMEQEKWSWKIALWMVTWPVSLPVTAIFFSGRK